MENRFAAKIFLKEDTPNKEVSKIVNSLKRNDKIKIELIDKTKAIEIFSKRINVDNKNLLQEINFPVSININFTEKYSYSDIISFLKRIKKKKYVDSIYFPEKTAYFLVKNFTIVFILFFSLLIILSVGLVLIIRKFYAKTLGMLSEEYKIKSLIGVKPFKINFPYSFSVFLISLMASLFVITLFFLMISITQGKFLFEKRMLFPIIITLIFNIIIMKQKRY